MHEKASTMKKLHLITLVFTLIFCMGIAAGCEKRQDPGAYLGQELQRIQSGKADIYGTLLQDELAHKEIQDFPEELEKAYRSFLKEVYKNIRYEIIEVDEESRNHFRAKVSIEPLCLGDTVAPIHDDSMKNMQSDNLATQVKEMMILDQDQLSQSKYERPVTVTIRLEWDPETDQYVLNENDYMEFLNLAVIDKLAVYEDVAKIFDIRNYVRACLDAALKGEFKEYCLQTGQTEEAAQKEYERSFWNETLDEAGFNEEEKTKMIAFLKAIASATDYTVGLPQRNGSSYLVPVTGTENLSLLKAQKEMEARPVSEEGETEEAFRKRVLEIFQNYAEHPVMGESFLMEVHVSSDDGQLLSIQPEDNEALAAKLLPNTELAKDEKTQDETPSAETTQAEK